MTQDMSLIWMLDFCLLHYYYFNVSIYKGKKNGIECRERVSHTHTHKIDLIYSELLFNGKWRKVGRKIDTHTHLLVSQIMIWRVLSPIMFLYVFAYPIIMSFSIQFHTLHTSLLFFLPFFCIISFETPHTTHMWNVGWMKFSFLNFVDVVLSREKFCHDKKNG